jgi:hypothetical protein
MSIGLISKVLKKYKLSAKKIYIHKITNKDKNQKLTQVERMDFMVILLLKHKVNKQKWILMTQVEVQLINTSHKNLPITTSFKNTLTTI